MRRRSVYGLGLFLGSVAAFALGFGHPHVVQAAPGPRERSSVEQVMATDAGKAALARAGVSEARFREMLSKLSPEQKQELEKLAAEQTPKVRLTARLLAAGYTAAEAKERIALLTDEEIARLAESPDATTGGGVVIAVLVAAVVLVAGLVFGWFKWFEPSPTPSEPPPAK